VSRGPSAGGADRLRGPHAERSGMARLVEGKTVMAMVRIGGRVDGDMRAKDADTAWPSTARAIHRYESNLFDLAGAAAPGTSAMTNYSRLFRATIQTYVSDLFEGLDVVLPGSPRSRYLRLPFPVPTGSVVIGCPYNGAPRALTRRDLRLQPSCRSRTPTLRRPSDATTWPRLLGLGPVEPQSALAGPVQRKRRTARAI